MSYGICRNIDEVAGELSTDPLTGRDTCYRCRNQQHEFCRSQIGEACYCVCLSKETFAAEERKRIREARKARKKLEQEALETSPLRVSNDAPIHLP